MLKASAVTAVTGQQAPRSLPLTEWEPTHILRTTSSGENYFVDEAFLMFLSQDALGFPFLLTVELALGAKDGAETFQRGGGGVALCAVAQSEAGSDAGGRSLRPH